MTTDATLVEEQYCTFWVSGLFFGVAVAEVQEVLRTQPMTPVPRAADAVTGLINLRGQIVTAVDLRVRLGFPPRDPATAPMNVIVRSRGEVVSLLVDDIGDVIDLAEIGGVAPEPVPSNMPARVQDVVSGVRPLAGSILLVLDADRAVDVSSAPDTAGGKP
ncbi:MAG: chemotaxis protein CheW [Nocardioidaceae bacterium]|nr:chemotaxis protein CheW [Nocardioidaceae bacterium]